MSALLPVWDNALVVSRLSGFTSANCASTRLAVLFHGAVRALLRPDACKQHTSGFVVRVLRWRRCAGPGRGEEWLLRLARDDDLALPLLIITSSRPHYRPPWSGSAGAQSVTLQPLSDETTVELLQKRIGATTLPPKFVKLAVGKTQGNPLFLEEITNYLFDNGQISRRGTDIHYKPAAAGFALPISLDNLLLERFDRLDEGPRRVLESASVIGPSFSQDLVEDASKLNGAVAARRPASRSMAGPTAAIVIGTIGRPVGGGENAGVISVKL